MNDKRFIVYLPPESSRGSDGHGPGSRDGVVSAYLEALRGLGNTEVASDPESLATMMTRECHVIAFSPLPAGAPGSRAAAVIFTGYDVHDDSYRTGPSGRWSDCLDDYSLIVCASGHTAHTVWSLAGRSGRAIAAIPPPLFERHDTVRRNHDRTREIELAPSAVYVDSNNLLLPSEGLVEPILSAGDSNLTEGGDSDMPRVLDFRRTGECLCMLRSFVLLEDRGAWTNADRAMILLPRRVSGRIRFSMSYAMIGAPRPESIALRLGPGAEPILIPGDDGTFTRVVDVPEPVDQLHFSAHSGYVASDSPEPLHLLVERVALDAVDRDDAGDRRRAGDKHAPVGVPVTGGPTRIF